MFDALDYEEELILESETEAEREGESESRKNEEIEEECSEFQDVETDYLIDEVESNPSEQYGETDFGRPIFSRIHQISKLSEERTEYLFREISKGGESAEKAKQELEEHNLRFVDFMVCRYFKHSELSREDAFQEGYFGLRRAIEKYNNNRNTKFSTYAASCIYRAIKRAEYEQKNCIRIPENAQIIKNNIEKAEIALTQKLSRKPSVSEIAEEIKMSVKQVERRRNLPVASLIFDKEVSVEGEENDCTLGELYADPEANTEDYCVQNELHVLLSEAVGILSEREQAVVIMHFGLHGGDGLSFAKIADALSVTPGRISQINKEALEKIRRHPYFGKKLKAYMDAA